MEATPEPSEEELNPYSIFPQPEQNFMVTSALVDICSFLVLRFSISRSTHLKPHSLILIHPGVDSVIQY